MNEMISKGVFGFIFFAIVGSLSIQSLSIQAETLAWWRFEEGIDGAVVTSVKDFGEDGQSDGDRSGGDVM